MFFFFFCFFFQAEDGIRDFCLSRGLGDVYKRQDNNSPDKTSPSNQDALGNQGWGLSAAQTIDSNVAVSYTHLTLPTKRIV